MVVDNVWCSLLLDKLLSVTVYPVFRMYNFSTLVWEHYNLEESVDQDETVMTSASGWTMPFFLFVVVTVLIKVNESQQNKLGHIPGPWSLPLIGTLHRIGLNPRTSFKTLGNLYGDVFKIKIGSKDIVVLRGLDTIKDALQKTDDFSGRPFLFTFQYLSGGKSLSFSGYDQIFKTHKQLAHRSLSRYLAESDAVNTVVQQEAQELAMHFLSMQGKPMDPSKPVLWAVGHVLYNMCFGNSRDQKQDFEHLVNGTVNLINMHNSGSVINFVPLARRILNWKVREIRDTCHGMCQIAVSKEQEHLKTYQPGMHRDAIDFLIEASLKNKDKIRQDRLLHTSQDFLGAGLDIVQVAVTWAILYLAEYGDIQDKLKQELRNAIDDNAIPQKEDRIKLPYMQAFILEVLRHSSLVPFALPHDTIRDSSVRDIVIPKGTFVLVDLYSVHSSENLWGDPENFRPERFLNASGHLDYSAMDLCIPFSIGKRKCLGQVFAKQEMLMFLSVLLQKCNICKPENVAQYDLKSDFGLICRPKPFKVVIFPA